MNNRIVLSSSGGTGRILYLAEELNKMQALECVMTSFYSKKHPILKKIIGVSHHQKIELSRVKDNFPLAMLGKVLNKYKMTLAPAYDPRELICDKIDKFVARNLKAGNKFLFAESNIALHSFVKQKELGGIRVLNRTNSHILYQEKILKDEYENLGLDFKFNSDFVVQKGLAEYEEADYIAVLSSFVKRSFLEYGVAEDKLLMIPSGVDLSSFYPEPKEDNKFRIVYVGLICVKKGIHYLLEAFKKLSLPNAELCLIGAVLDDIRPVLDKYYGSFTHVPYVAHDQLRKYMSQGSIFVLPSLEEGMAKVTMEAMACGVPVIATANTGAEDIITDGKDGYVIPIREVEAMMQKIEELYKNESLRSNMSIEAQAKVKNKFTWERYAKDIVNNFNKIGNL